MNGKKDKPEVLYRFVSKSLKEQGDPKILLSDVQFQLLKKPKIFSQVKVLKLF
jgi:hypothetical protein